MSDKKKRNLIIVLCVLAVIIAIVAVAFAPFGKKATGNSDSPNIIETENTTTESTTLQETENTETSAISTETTFVVPSSTDPIINPNKNYTLFIDKTVFESTEDGNGTTTITAKDNRKVTMIVTPIRDKSYKECCRKVEENHKELDDSAKLKIENRNSAYRSQTGDSDYDTITTVYCVDDKKGGCIIIEYKAPVSATEYTKTIEIMLSMFKVL